MYIGIDVGATNTRVALFDNIKNPKLLSFNKFKTVDNYQQDLENIFSAINNFKIRNPKRIGIGTPAVFDSVTYQLLIVDNVKSWQGKNIKKDLESYFKCQVKINNDTACAGLGEALWGRGKDKEFLFIIWGTGIGGVYIKRQNSKITLMLSELGHHIIKKDGLLCHCGQRGCFQAYCSGGSILDQYKKTIDKLEKAEQNSVIEHFTLGLLNSLAFYLPKLVIIGGGVTVNNLWVIERVKKELKKRLKITPLPKIVTSSLKDQAGVWGALALFEKTILV